MAALHLYPWVQGDIQNTNFLKRLMPVPKIPNHDLVQLGLEKFQLSVKPFPPRIAPG